MAGITGGESAAQSYAKTLSDEVGHSRDGVTVRSGGVAMVNVQITSQSQRDLLLMEAIAIPFSFLVLVWVFGGLLAGLGLVLITVPWPAGSGSPAPLRRAATSGDVESHRNGASGGASGTASHLSLPGSRSAAESRHCEPVLATTGAE